MTDFIKLTQIVETETNAFDNDIYLSKYQIQFLNPDPEHNQTYVVFTDKEIKVRQSVSEIITLFQETL